MKKKKTRHRTIERLRVPLRSLADGASKNDVTWKVFRSTYERLLKLPPQARQASSASTPSCTRKLILELTLAFGSAVFSLSQPCYSLFVQFTWFVDASPSHSGHSLSSVSVSPSSPDPLFASLTAILASSSRSGAPVRAARARELSRPKAERTKGRSDWLALKLRDWLNLFYVSISISWGRRVGSEERKLRGSRCLTYTRMPCNAS